MPLSLDYLEELPIKVAFHPELHLVIEKFPLVRNALSSLISNLSPAAQIAEMGSIRDFEKGRSKLPPPATITLDMHLNDSLGLSGIQTVRRYYKDTPLILLCDEVSKRTEKLCLDAGATTCIGKSSSLSLIRNELAKHISDRSAAPIEISTLSEVRLTRRMRQLILMIGRGMRNEEISQELGLSIHTVKLHLYRLYQRLGVRSRTQLIAKSHQMGWLL